VNETFARRFLRAGDELGARILERSEPDAPARHLEVVGIVEDAMYRALKEPVPPTIYTAFEAEREAGADLLVVRPRGTLNHAFTRRVVDAIVAIAGQRSLTTRTLADQVGAQYAQDRLLAGVAVASGVLAIVLCALGVFGVTRYAANRRRFEIGVRIALGATPADVRGLFLRSIGAVVGAGVALGLVGTLWAGQFVQALLYQVDAGDGSAKLVASVIVAVVALCAVWWPALRASRIEPVQLLRDASQN
jgi:hypothetical protein